MRQEEWATDRRRCTRVEHSGPSAPNGSLTRQLQNSKNRLLTRAARNSDLVFSVAYRAVTVRERWAWRILQLPLTYGGGSDSCLLLGFACPSLSCRAPH